MTMRPARGYLNAASQGVPDPAVQRRTIEYLELEARVGPARALSSVVEEHEEVRAMAARLIGADARDVVFATSGTRAWTGVVASLRLRGGRVLAAPHEWGANLHALEARGDVQVETLPALSGHAPDLAEWAARLDEDVRALLVPMVSSVDGRRYPVEDIGALERPNGCAYVLDAAQALGQMPVSVRRIGCDALAAPTRKWLRGPRGTAIAWRRPGFGIRDEAQMEHASDFDVGSRLGLGVALRQASPEILKTTERRILELARRARRLAADRGVSCLSSAEPQSGITTLLVPEGARLAVRDRLRAADCELKWLDAGIEPKAMRRTEGANLLRLSAHGYNTESDLIDALDAIAAGIASAA